MIRPLDAQSLAQSHKVTPTSVALSGLRVLIVEDDYYLAMDAKTVLQNAGAEVIGPVSGFRGFERALADHEPDCAVVDINLGQGPTFATAKRLEADGVPFLFLTGYSPEAVAPEFQHITQIRKPAKVDGLVQSVLELCA